MTGLSAAELDEALRALSHAERRRFLRLCWGKSVAAGELADLSALSMATVSEHLKVLRKTGLVVLRVEGRFWYYQTDGDRLGAVLAAMKDDLDGA